MFVSYSDRIFFIRISNGNSDYSEFGGYLLFLLQHHFDNRALNGSRTVKMSLPVLKYHKLAILFTVKHLTKLCEDINKVSHSLIYMENTVEYHLSELKNS